MFAIRRDTAFSCLFCGRRGAVKVKEPEAKEGRKENFPSMTRNIPQSFWPWTGPEKKQGWTTSSTSDADWKASCHEQHWYAPTVGQAVLLLLQGVRV